MCCHIIVLPGLHSSAKGYLVDSQSKAW